MDKDPTEKPGMASLSGAILFLFFVSGSLGLIYQVVWLRMLILIFGSTHFAVATVLTAFMAGLALGAWVLGRQIDRKWSPLVVYGLFEIGIGLYALMIPWMFTLLTPVSRWLWSQYAPSYYTFSILRFFFVGAVLILPTSLMGGTLPALSRFVTRRSEAMGLSVGSLYSANTFGAVLGTAATGFLLVPWLGVQKTIWVAAALNVLVGAISLGIWTLSGKDRGASSSGSSARLAVEDDRALLRAGDPLEERPAARPAPRSGALPGRVRLVLVIFGLSGLLAMIYEIAWTRVLALIIGSSVYAFTIMLTTFLIGLAVGASVMARLADRLGSRLGADAMAIIMAGTAATAFATLSMLHQLPYAFSVAFHSINESGGQSQGNHLLLFGLQFAMAALVMLPPTLFLGGMFPLVVRICGDVLKQVGHTVGTAYASNTVGTIFGSALGGFLIVPLFGIQGSIVLAVMTNFILAAVLVLWVAPEATRGRVMVAVLLVTSAAGAWALQPEWNTLLMNSGVYKYAADMTKRDLTEDGFYQFTEGNFDLVYYREGVTATVMVAAEKLTKDLWLSVNGKIDASSHGDLQTQLLSAHLPMLLADGMDEVAVIGYASGITVGAATVYPIDSLTAIEIEPSVVEASQEFSEHNHDPLSNPLVDVVEADGRNYLLVADRQFDVIISEPSNPWMTVASNLFTREFFEIGRDRLKPGGVFCQWLQIYGMQPSDLKALARTFATVFPHVIVFNPIVDSDLLLIGSSHPLDFRIDELAGRMADLEVALDLGRIRVTSPYDLLTYFIMGNEEFRAFAGEGPLNTDDNALIEFHAPKNLHAETRQRNLDEIRGHFVDPWQYLHEKPAGPEGKADFYERMSLAYFRRGMKLEALRAVGIAIATDESEDLLTLREQIMEYDRKKTAP
jgi:spermidine synthase